MFLWNRLSELNNYLIHLDWHLTSDHILLTITIPIIEENVNLSKHSIAKNSKEELVFIKDVITTIKGLDTSNLYDVNSLENAINMFTHYIECIWEKNSKYINIIRHFKSWWNKKCNKSLNTYRMLKKLEDWKSFWKMVKNTKHTFFNLKIQEITNKKQGPWELMN